MLQKLSVLVVLAALAVGIHPVGDAFAGKGGGKGNGGGGGSGDGGGTPADPAIAYLAGGRLMVMDADGSNQTELLPAGNGKGGQKRIAYNHSRPSWSPDGTRIAFGSEIDGSPGIYVIDANGTGLTRVADLRGSGTKLAWAPISIGDAGYEIAFTDTPSGDSDTDVFLLNPTTGAVMNLTQTENVSERHPTWSYDGARLAFSRDSFVDTGAPSGYDDDDVIVLTLTTSDGVPSIASELNISNLGDSPLDSEDVRQPAFAKTQDLLLVKTGGGAGWHGDFWIVDLGDASNPENITDGVDQFRLQASWSADDTMIVFNGSNDAYQDGGSIWTIEIATGDSTELVRRDNTDATRREFPDWRR